MDHMRHGHMDHGHKLDGTKIVTGTLGQGHHYLAKECEYFFTF